MNRRAFLLQLATILSLYFWQTTHPSLNFSKTILLFALLLFFLSFLSVTRQNDKHIFGVRLYFFNNFVPMTFEFPFFLHNRWIRMKRTNILSSFKLKFLNSIPLVNPTMMIIHRLLILFNQRTYLLQPIINLFSETKSNHHSFLIKKSSKSKTDLDLENLERKQRI